MPVPRYLQGLGDEEVYFMPKPGTWKPKQLPERRPVQWSYWHSASNLAKWYNKIQTQPPDQELPPWLDREGVTAAYQYQQYMNRGRPWWAWGAIHPDDPYNDFLVEIPNPPLEELSPVWRERKQAEYEELTSPYETPYTGAIPAEEYETVPWDQSTYDKVVQELAGGVPDEIWQQLPYYQKALMTLLGSGSRAGAAIGGTAGLFGGLGGALAGGGIGTLLGGGIGGGLLGSVLGKAMEKYPSVGKFMEYLDYPALWLEQAIGTFGILAGSPFELAFGEIDKQKFNDLWNNIDAVWQASALMEEAMALGFVGGKTFDLGVPGVRIVEDDPSKLLYEVFDRIVSGEPLEDIYTYYIGRPHPILSEGAVGTGELGMTGMLGDLIGHIAIDPLNYMGAILKLPVKAAAVLSGNDVLQAASHLGKGPIETLQMYKQAVRHMPDDEIAKLSPLAKQLVGIAPDGTAKWLQPAQPPTRAQRVTGAAVAGLPLTAIGYGIGGLPGAVLVGGLATHYGFKQGLPYLFTLTPVARANELISSSGPIYNAVLDSAKDNPAGQVKYLHIWSNNPRDLSRELSMGVIRSPEGELLPGAIAGYLETADALLDQWNKSEWMRLMANNIATTTGKSIDDVVRELADMTDARTLLDQYVSLARNVDSDEARAIAQAYDLGKADPNADGALKAENLQDMAKAWIEDKVPYREELFKANLYGGLLEHTAEYGGKWFGVQPDSRVIRLSRAIKSAQSALLLGLNPTYLVNNAINNFVTMGASSVLGLRSADDIVSIWKRFGYTLEGADQPVRLTAGLGPHSTAGDAVHLEALRKMTRGGDWIQTLEDFFGRSGQIMPFTRMSSAAESWSSKQAMTSGLLQAWGKLWKRGVGYDRMPGNLERMLDAIQPGLKELVYDGIDASMNKQEVLNTLYSGVARRSVRSMLDDVATKQGLDPGEVREAWSQLGLFDDIERAIREAESDQDIRDAFRNITEKIEDELDLLTEQRVRSDTEEAANIAAAEGLRGVFKANDDDFISDLEFQFRHWLRMDDLHERAEIAKKTTGTGGYIWEEGLRIEDKRYRRHNKRMAARLKGFIDGLGDTATDSKAGRGIIDEMGAIYDDWGEFYRIRRQMYDDLRTGKITDYDGMKAELLDIWRATWERAETRFAAMDAGFVRVFAEQFGEDIAPLVEAWRSGVAEVRQNNYAVMDQMRASGDTDWRAFLHDKGYLERLRQLVEVNRDGLEDIERALTGLDPLHREPVPETPERPPDVDWQMGGADISEGRRAQAEREAAEAAEDVPENLAEFERLKAQMEVQQEAARRQFEEKNAEVMGKIEQEQEWQRRAAENEKKVEEALNIADEYKVETPGAGRRSNGHANHILNAIKRNAPREIQDQVQGWNSLADVEPDLMRKALEERARVKQKAVEIAEADRVYAENLRYIQERPFKELDPVIRDAMEGAFNNMLEEALEPQLSVLRFIREEGGINIKYMPDIALEGKYQAKDWGPGLFTRKGMPLDHFIVRMTEEGYIPTDIEGGIDYGLEARVIEMIQDELAKRQKYYPMEGKGPEQVPDWYKNVHTGSRKKRPAIQQAIQQIIKGEESLVYGGEPTGLENALKEEAFMRLEDIAEYDEQVARKTGFEYRGGEDYVPVPEGMDRGLGDRLASLRHELYTSEDQATVDAVIDDLNNIYIEFGDDEQLLKAFNKEIDDLYDAAKIERNKYTAELEDVPTPQEAAQEAAEISQAQLDAAMNNLIEEIRQKERINRRYQVWADEVNRPMDALPAPDVRDYLRRGLELDFGLGEDQIAAQMEILDARARTWASQTGRSPDEWWRTRIWGTAQGEGGRRILYQEALPYAPTWYRQVERVVSDIPQETFTVDQLRGMIKKGGVKADEMKWSGMDDFLRETKGKVTKQEVIDYLNWNRVEVEEVVYGAIPAEPFDQQKVRVIRGESRVTGEPTAEVYYDGQAIAFYESDYARYTFEYYLNDAQIIYNRAQAEAGRKTKYETYTLPGGENYRELLFTLPENRRIKEIDAELDVLVSQARGLRDLPITAEEDQVYYGNRILEIERQIDALHQERGSIVRHGYQAPHWDEPNVLAHVRFNERVDADGNKVLFIEEIQSDWHQAGREKGYAGPEITNRIAEIDQEVSNIQGKVRSLQSSMSDMRSRGIGPESETYRGFSTRMQKLNTDIMRLAEERNKLFDAVPKAPFAKSWDELAIKRMLRWAAENDFDKVAWTTGEQQALRYNQALREVADTIAVNSNADGTYMLVVTKNNQVVRNYNSLDSATIADYIGKELAEQLTTQADNFPGTPAEVSGENVVFGGRGMRVFYDRILPKSAEKIGKKFGARVYDYNISPRRNIEQAEKMLVEFSEQFGVTRGMDMGLEPFPSPDIERNWRGLQEIVESGYIYDWNVHAIDITPEMKQSVLFEGQPLFHGPNKGAIEWTNENQAILRALTNPDISTTLHETGHIFRKDLYRTLDEVTDQAVWAQVRKDIQTLEDWVRAETPEYYRRVFGEGGAVGIDEVGNWTRAGEETFARAVERYFTDGWAPTEGLRRVFEQFKTWLLNIYTQIVGSHIDVDITPELRAVLDRLLAEGAQQGVGQMDMFGPEGGMPLFTGTPMRGREGAFRPREVDTTRIMPGFEEVYKPQMEGARPGGEAEAIAGAVPIRPELPSALKWALDKAKPSDVLGENISEFRGKIKPGMWEQIRAGIGDITSSQVKREFERGIVYDPNRNILARFIDTGSNRSRAYLVYLPDETLNIRYADGILTVTTEPNAQMYDVDFINRIRNFYSGAEPEAPKPALEVTEAIPETFLDFSPQDIDRKRAEAAFYNISWTPEKRADSVIQGYVRHMQEMIDEFSPLADTPEKVEKLKAHLQRYKENYIKKYYAYLDAKSRTASAFITGPSKFPTAQNEKRLATEMKRWDEFKAWYEKAQRAIRNDIDPRRTGVIRGGDPEAISKLETKIAKLEANHEMMKEINKIVRKKGLDDEQRIQQIIATGLNETAARELLKPDFAGREGFAGWELSNNLAEIKRLRGRLTELTRLEARQAGEWIIEGGRILENTDNNRIQIFFDEKPEADVRSRLKSRGFRWAPSEGAWQRQRTENALRATRELFPDMQKIEVEEAPERIIGIDLPPAEDVEPPEDTLYQSDWFNTDTGAKRIIDGSDETNILYQNGDGNIDVGNVDGEDPQATGLPVGSIEAMDGEVPLHKVSEEGYDRFILPLMDGLEQSYLNGEANVPASVRDTALPEDVSNLLKMYLQKVYGQMNDTKIASQRWAEMRRDAALLNYSRRYGIDNVATALIPYQFWYTRSALQWALRAIDRPSWFANYGRINRMQEQVTAQPGFPTRLLGKMRMKVHLPWLPESYNEIYFDPWHQLFPFSQLTYGAWEQPAQIATQQGRRAVYIIQQWVADEKITQDQAIEALKIGGTTWEKAFAQAAAEMDNEISTPADYIAGITGYSLPLEWWRQYNKGTPENINQLPATRLIQSATSFLTPGGINIEGWVRNKLGLPERGKWWDYYIDRELANMAAEGLITADEAMQTMVERQGRAYDMAMDRVGKYQATRQIGGALWLDFFPEGEAEQRALGVEFGKIIDTGDSEMLSEWFENHPEYKARLLMGDWDSPEGRLRNFTIGRIWERYREGKDLEKTQWREAFGQVYEDAFLNKETRSYDSIDTQTLLQWAQVMGVEEPETTPGYEMPPIEEIDYEFAPPEVQDAVQEYHDERKRLFPEYSYDKQEIFFMLPDELQDQYLEENPWLEEYWQWANKYKADHPEIIQYSIGEDSVIKDAPPELQQLYYEYKSSIPSIFGGDIYDVQNSYYDLPAGARRREFLKEHPELLGMWQYRYTMLQNYPELIPYIYPSEGRIDEIATKQKYTESDFALDLSQFTPALNAAMNAYYNQGAKLGSGAKSELSRIWKNSGRPGGDLNTWIESLFWLYRE